MQTIDLTNEDAELFLSFRKNQDVFSVLDKQGIFDIKNGSVEIHFDAAGTMANIVKHEVIYRRGVIPVVVLRTKL